MKDFFARLLETLFGKKKPPQPVCAFCKEAGHTEDDCPNAAKYKMFGERE